MKYMKKRKKKSVYQRKISYEFFRWGTLSPQVHKEARLPDDHNDRTFHTAPVKKGFYAFPKGYIEDFLLGLSPSKKNPDILKNGRFFWLKDDLGRKITQDKFYIQKTNLELDYEHPRPEILKLLSRRRIKLSQISFYDSKNINQESKNEDFIAIYSPMPRKFIYSGPYIWHHLKEYYVFNSENKMLVDKEDIISEKGDWIKTTMKVWLSALKRIDTIYRWNSYMIYNPKGSRHGDPHTYPSRYSKDEFEVFIEKI